MLLPEVRPGDQVVVIPDWVYKNLAKKGKVEDLVNFSLMRQWFTQEQLVAIDEFSRNGLARVIGGEQYTKSLGYSWFFPEESGQSKNGSEADSYARGQLSDLSNNKEYANKMANDYVYSVLALPPGNKFDLHQSYSVYSGSNKLIVLVLNQGCLNPVVTDRQQELRISILRSIVGKLQEYYNLNVVHQSDWFGWYFSELNKLA